MPAICAQFTQGTNWGGLCEYVMVHTKLPPSPVILWIDLGGKPKWRPLNSGYHDVMRPGPIALHCSIMFKDQRETFPQCAKHSYFCVCLHLWEVSQSRLHIFLSAPLSNIPYIFLSDPLSNIPHIFLSDPLPNTPSTRSSMHGRAYPCFASSCGQRCPRQVAEVDH